jgi:hypothetical protein
MATRTHPAVLQAHVDHAPDVAMTRDALRRSLGALGWHTHAVDVAVLVASELVTNGLQHVGPPVDVEVARSNGFAPRESSTNGDTVRIAVRDRSGQGPSLRDRGDEHGGFGMRLIARAANAWGWYADDHGKVVWAEVCDAPERRT